MKNTIYTFLLLSLILYSCSKNSEELSKEQILKSTDWKLESATPLEIIRPDDPNFGAIFTFPQILRLNDNHSLESIMIFEEAQTIHSLGTWEIIDDVNMILGGSKANIKQLNTSEWIYHLNHNYNGSIYLVEIKRVPNK